MEISGGVSGICCGVCGIDRRGLPAINLLQYSRRHDEINVTQALCANRHKSVVTRSTWVTITRRIEESVLHMMTVTCGEAHIGAYYASCEPMKRKLNKGCTYQDKWTITTQYSILYDVLPSWSFSGLRNNVIWFLWVPLVLEGQLL